MYDISVMGTNKVREIVKIDKILKSLRKWVTTIKSCVYIYSTDKEW